MDGDPRPNRQGGLTKFSTTGAIGLIPPPCTSRHYTKHYMSNTTTLALLHLGDPVHVFARCRPRPAGQLPEGTVGLYGQEGTAITTFRSDPRKRFGQRANSSGQGIHNQVLVN